MADDPWQQPLWLELGREDAAETSDEAYEAHPPHPPERQRRTCSKLIRFTPDELKAVRSRAWDCGRPVACYIRESAIGPKPRARPGRWNDALIYQMYRVGMRMRRLAERATVAGTSEATEVEAVIGDLLKIVRDVASNRVPGVPWHE